MATVTARARAPRFPPPPPLALWVTAHPSPGPPPRPGQPLFVNGHLKMVQHLNTVIWKLGILKSFAFAFKMPSAPKSARPRTITYATMPSLTIAFVDSQRTQRYTRHRRVTTACRATGRSSSSSSCSAASQSAYSASHCRWRACACWLGRRRANQAQIQSCGSGGAACPLIRPSHSHHS